MRQQRNRDRREQDMVAVDTILRVSMPAVEPPAGGERANDMLVGAPGEDLRNLFDFRTGAGRIRFAISMSAPVGRIRNSAIVRPCRNRIKRTPPTPSKGFSWDFRRGSSST